MTGTSGERQAFLNGSATVGATDADATRDCLDAVVEDLLKHRIPQDLLTASASAR